MILCRLVIHMKEGKLTRDVGRAISKNLARALTSHYKEDMIAFYPSLINVDNLELIGEVIGNNNINNGKFDFDALTKDVKKYVRKLNLFSFKDILINEITFCEAAFSMIYCYKQDDYLIPDSDPHDVMASENIYNDAKETYSGRFLPLIKLWCDITQITNLIFTASMGNTKNILNKTLSKSLEFEALTKTGMMQELKNIDKGNQWFTPFNKFYKVLISDRTMLPCTLSPLIDKLYENNQLSTKSYYVLDVIDTFYALNNDQLFLSKIDAILKELSGSTLVFLVDIPNHFLLTKERYSVDMDAYQLQKNNKSEEQSDIDKSFSNKMMEYNLLDSDDSIDFELKINITRKIISAIDKSLSDKEDNKSDYLEGIGRLAYARLRKMNIVLAYTDTMAYNQSYIFNDFIKMTEALSIDCVPLSNATFGEKELDQLALSSMLKHFGFDNNKFTDKLFSLEDMKELEETLLSLIKEAKDSNVASLESLFMLRYFVRHNLDFNSAFARNETYFSAFKTAKKKAQSKLKKKLSKDEQDEYNKISGADDIDPEAILSSSKATRKFGSLLNSSFDKNTFESTKKGEISLAKMIGLVEIKEQVKDFTDFVQLNKIKKEKGLDPIPISKHMVFMGNPGTAKTTVARQLAKILYDKGLIPKNIMKHVSRDDLVGKYVGWTAKLVKQAIEEAKGGILFVDEAYSLTSGEGGSNSYGMEAINTFVNYMDKSDVRDSTIIIFAGYKDEMKEFIDSNPGLKSRIGFYFDFPDYTTDELLQIAKVQAEDSNYTLEQGYMDKLKEAIVMAKGAKDFGNGRFVRNIFEKSVLKQASRLMQDTKKAENSSFSKEELTTIKAEDFSTRGIEVGSSNKGMGFLSKTFKDIKEKVTATDRDLGVPDKIDIEDGNNNDEDGDFDF